MKNNESQYVVFRLGEEYYGINIEYVQTIERMMNITRVPKTEKYVKGVINLRGEIVPVIDLKDRFNLLSGEYTNDTRIIVNRIDDILIGFIVDSASEVKEITEENIDYNIVDDNFNDGFVKGIGKLEDRIVILIDEHKILDVK
ncbi:purine-binding chemotaxis protein CheW [Alkalithermobacter thermoalcaliphilus JW-YL-7 = DSM 7308]|uniref:CheW protein n=1 Tax=Alkalithermobacter thermoalcaliphilus JW-YL-7 = DSM 7308 TaxID=1121328 RepID=A0A150FQ88_CLOPD|nr:CheW protein [[Clostridium] paradoxum JW-YL-7 = DSM 7308]SHK60375.1 purine-binding chemotaxis protein CheW [[Clostridium] paradoxum JW-YL-7 = DSM 7308]